MNPFLPFPFPDAIFHVRRGDRLFAVYPLFPWQKYFWTMPPDSPDWDYRVGPFFISVRLP